MGLSTAKIETCKGLCCCTMEAHAMTAFSSIALSDMATAHLRAPLVYYGTLTDGLDAQSIIWMTMTIQNVLKHCKNCSVYFWYDIGIAKQLTKCRKYGEKLWIKGIK